MLVVVSPRAKSVPYFSQIVGTLLKKAQANDLPLTTFDYVVDGKSYEGSIYIHPDLKEVEIDLLDTWEKCVKKVMNAG